MYIEVALGHFTITLGSLWSHFGYMKCRFQKTPIFPTDFNDFIKDWGEFGVTLGSLLAYEGDFRATLGSLWSHFGYLNVEWHI